jgi:hypothetical protein
MRKTFIALFVLSVLANGLLVQQSYFSEGNQSIISTATSSISQLVPTKVDPSILLQENLIAQKAQELANTLQNKVKEQQLAIVEAERKESIVKRKKSRIKTKRALRKVAPQSILHAYAVSLTSEKASNEISLNVKGIANESFGVYIISKQGKVEAFYEFAANTASERKMALNISHLDKGTYFAHLVGKGDRVVKKFVKI